MKLTIGNSMCQLSGLTKEHRKALRQLTSYQISEAEAYFSHRSSRDVFLMSAKGEFPTGLLYIVENYLADRGLKYDLVDPRVVPKKGSVSSTTLFLPGKAPIARLEQTAAAEAARLYGRGILVAPTGTGKSLISALICDIFRMPTLIVVPSLELKRQLTESLYQWFGLTNTQHIVVQNIAAIDPTVELKYIGLLLIDEFHHSAAKMYQEANVKAWKNIYHKIGLTATPFRSKDTERLLLESVLSKVIYKVDYHHAVQQKHIVPMESYFYDLPVQEIKGNEANWHSVYSELVVNNVARNRLLIQTLGKLHAQQASTLCLVKEIKHGQFLSDLTCFPFANGQDGQSKELIKAFNEGQIKTLIGTSGVLGEGIDTRPAEYIILAGGGKSKNQFMQNVGRGFRNYEGKESCKIIMFRDKSHKWLIQHFNACVRYLREEYGAKPIRLTIE